MEILGLIDVPSWLVLITLVILLIYIYGTSTFVAFNGTGLKGPKPYPVVGNFLGVFVKGFLDYDIELMKKYGETVAGFEGRTPVIYTTDEEILKTVFIKDFQNFMNRRSFEFGQEEIDTALSLAKDDTWRRLRMLLSPTFSSGKLKQMNHQLNECGKLLVENIEEYSHEGKSCDIKSVAQAFTMDAIARTAFGLELNTQKDPDNPFVKMGQAATNGSIFNPIFLLTFLFPFMIPVVRRLGIPMLPQAPIKFFSNVTKQALEERRKEGSRKQADFLQLMMNAHQDQTEDNDVTDPAINKAKGKETFKQGLSHAELVAQSIMFFLAGFETTAVAITYLCYNLAVNPDKQQKLLEEVHRLLKDKDIIDYNTLSEMTYLDQCVQESLRLFPPAFRTERSCNKDTVVKGIHIKKGWVVCLPIWAMHHNPDLWPDPEAFIPERFENKTDIGSKWMPFGNGPRNCIGMRLALIEVKMVVAQLVKNYELVKTTETEVPIQFNKRTIMQPLKPIKIGFVKRTPYNKSQ